MIVRTIRQRFKRRMLIALLVCTGGSLVTVLSIAYAGHGAPGPDGLLQRLVPLLGMISVCTGLVLSGTGRCPRCLNVANPFIVFYKRCPACGISLDEPCS